MRPIASSLFTLAALTAGSLQLTVQAVDVRQVEAESLVRGLYTAVTFEAGETPDWDHVRSMFLDRATVVLRTTRTARTVFDRLDRQ